MEDRRLAAGNAFGSQVLPPARLSAFLDRAATTGSASIGAPFAAVVLATIAVGRGDAARARAVLEPIVGPMQALELPVFLAAGLTVQGSALLADGDVQAARAALGEAKEYAKRIDNQWLISLADYQLGRLARAGGEIGKAEDLHHDGLAIFARQGLRPNIAQSLEALAALASDHESYAEASRLFGAVSVLRTSIGLVRLPADQTDHDGELARARLALGDSAFDTAWAEGEKLTVEEAVAYASRARGERARPSSGWASLTPTELDVARLAAQGLTNPQIAERMFIARGTVKIHLSHIFAKLGFATRAELAGEAVRNGV